MCRGIFSINLMNDDEFKNLLIISEAHFIGTLTYEGKFLVIIALSINIFPP